jgi:FkbM family methyltransferase
MNTKNKIRLATVAYKIVHFVRSCIDKDDKVTVVRGGVNWNLDLNQGIDFSIFLIGGFEPGTLRLYRELLGNTEGEIVFDIGANIGAHTLPIAKLVTPKNGKVYAFEPTRYAYEKLLQNVSLNPSIQHGIVPVQAMIAAKDDTTAEPEIYSSWPLANVTTTHADHCGELKSTIGAEVFSLDSFVRMRDISRVDFIKLDVDGYEPEVLAGAWLSLNRFKPTILMEWTPYLFSERPDAMCNALSRLLGLGYSLFDGKSGKPISGGVDELDRRTPSKGSMNILLRFVARV